MREQRRRLVYEVVSRHGRGESIRGIARALHISRGAVRTILTEVSVHPIGEGFAAFPGRGP